MTHACIECFLAVCRYKTGTRAAEALFITQPSLSSRLKALETELGGSLFVRKKGGREMTLTAAGEEFYALALQYEDILAQMSQVCKKQKQTLRISSFNSLSTYFLPAVYERFMQRYPQISLELQDMELESAVRGIQTGTTDIVFTSGKVTDRQIQQVPVFSDPMVLVAAAGNDYQEPVTRSQLDPTDEVYVKWTSSFAAWHQQFWGSSRSRIHISIMAHLRQFIAQGKHWAIVPGSVAQGLQKEEGVCCLATDFPLPQWDISCLTTVENSKAAAVQMFFECLNEVVSERTNELTTKL